VRAAAAPVATDLQAELSSPAAVRKALLARGWDLAWIDGVTGEMQKKRLKATVPQIEAAVRRGTAKNLLAFCRLYALLCCLTSCPATSVWCPCTV
jgi:hypothetical protein